MKRVLLDVNVVLDVLLDRAPFAASASAVWELVERGEAEGLLSAHAVTALHYLNARAAGSRMARETTESLLSVFDVAAVDEGVLKAALALDMSDLEDAVTATAARRAKCDAVVTRNTADFRRARVRVLTPSEAVAWVTAGRRRSG